MSAARPLKRSRNRAQERLSRLVDDGTALSYRIDNILDRQNVLTALFAIGVSANIVAATEGLTAEQNAQESLCARELTKHLLASTDVLSLARILANCLSHLAVDTVYAPADSAAAFSTRKQTFEVS